METYFNSAHLRTIAKIQELALKHECIFSFGVNDKVRSNTVDYDILKKDKISKEAIEAIKEQDNNGNVEGAWNEYTSLWFELYDLKSKRCNQLIYIQSATGFRLDGGDDLMVEDAYNNKALSKFIEENGYDWPSSYFEYRDDPTQIINFDKEGRREDYRVYRSGMALKFFADLVCDYLEEPKIEEVY